jgi:hypothetical protein
MSQFPLEGGLPAVSKLRRSRSSGPTTLGITEDLNAPGVVPLPVEPTRSQRMIDQLSNVLGVAGQAVEAAGAVSAQDAARANRARAMLQEKQSEIAQADRGQGSLDARSATPELERQILAGELKPGVGPDGQPVTDEQFAEQYLAGRTNGLSQDYADAFASHAKPQIMEALARRREATLNLATAQNQDLILAGIATDNTPDSLEQSVSLLKGNNPKLSDPAARALVSLHAINNATDLADPEALDRAAKFAGDTFAPNVAVARTRIETRKLENKMRDQVATMDTFRSRLGLGEPADSVYADAVIAEKEGKISGTDLLAMRTRFDEEQRAVAREATRQLDTVSTQQWKANLNSVATAIMESGDKNGGASQLPPKFRFITPSGKEETITRQELVGSIVEDKFKLIDENEQTARDPDLNLAQKVDFLAKQGGGAVYEPWKAALNGVASQALRVDVANGRVPDAVVGAVDLYERLLAKKAYGVIGDHLTDEQSRNVLRLVDAVKRNMRGGGSGIGMTAQEALTTVLKSGNVRGLQNFSPVALHGEAGDAAKDVLGNFKKAENTDDIERVLSEKAGMYRALTGIGDAAAIARAGTDMLEDMQIIDGQAVFVRGRSIPRNMDQIAPAIKQEFLAEHGKSLGLSESDTSLLVDPISGLVTVQTKVGGIVPRDAPAFTLDDARQISAFAYQLQNMTARVRGIEEHALGRTRPGELVGAGTALYRMMFKPDRTTPEDQGSIRHVVTDAIKVPEDASPEAKAVMLRIARADPTVTRVL